MASTELLASKVVVLEEEPQIPAIAALPSAVLLVEGVTERGPINDPQLLTSFGDFKNLFGGFFTNGHVPLAIHGFFYQGGQFAWVNRVVHYTDLTDRTGGHGAVKGSVTLQNAGNVASAASVGPGSDTAPFALDPAQHIDIDIGAGPVVCTFDAAAADITDTATYPVSALSGGETLGITIAGANGGAEQTVTAAGGETTAVEMAALFNEQITGLQAEVSGGQVKLTTDRKGTGASIQITTGGTLNAVLGFSTSAVAGTGDVADIDAVTAAEAEAVIEADLAAAVTVTADGNGKLTIATVATGASAEIQVEATSTVTFGLDTDAHTGSDATPANTLTVEGKTEGAYAADITINVSAAPSLKAAEFTLKVLVNGVVTETFPNVTMDDDATNYVETVINDVNLGSNLIAVTDLDATGTVLQQRPANGTSSAMTGGDDGLTGLADADYIGNETGQTGLRAFDRVNTGRILTIPGVTSANVHLAMLEYAGDTRNGSMFCVIDCPSGYTAAQVVDFVDTNGLLEHTYGEFGAIYWPWIKVSNPQPSVFGTDDFITVAPSGWVAGKYASNDQKIGGIYESPAGTGEGFGVISGLRGVEDPPGGESEHPVLDERVRDYIYPNRINPITKLPGTSWHIDGGRTLKSTGNFPNVGERRGVINIEQTIKNALIVVKHRYNNRANRQRVGRLIEAYLTQEMNKGAFRSTNKSEAFFVDVSDALNPTANVFAGIMTVRIGLATNKPAEFIVILVTQDTRGLADAEAA